jgi:DNA-binding beta-propeller fold protein YncE
VSFWRRDGMEPRKREVTKETRGRDGVTLSEAKGLSGTIEEILRFAQDDRVAPAPQHSVPSAQHSPARGRKVVLLAGLLAALVAVVGFGGHQLMGEGNNASSPALPPMPGVTREAGPRFLFSINGVSRPLGVAVSPAGDRIYVTESDGDRETKVFDRDGRPVGALKPPASDRASRAPVYVAAGPDGNVYVSDRSAGKVFVYSGEGEALGSVEPVGIDGAWAPLALGFDGEGNLLATTVATGSHGAIVVPLDGREARRFGRQGAANGEYSYPNGIASDRMGRLLVADSNNARVAVLDPEGNLLWYFGRGGAQASLALPRGLAVDERNRVYVADTMSHTVLVYELGEENVRLLFTLGGHGIGDGQFNFPNGVALDVGHRLYVTDRENNRVQVWGY